jgi:hypothetical protein
MSSNPANLYSLYGCWFEGSTEKARRDASENNILADNTRHLLTASRKNRNCAGNFACQKV